MVGEVDGEVLEEQRIRVRDGDGEDEAVLILVKVLVEFGQPNQTCRRLDCIISGSLAYIRTRRYSMWPPWPRLLQLQVKEL